MDQVELTGPASPAVDSLVRVTSDALEVTSLGRLFIRNVCMVFDRYLRERVTTAGPAFSRAI